MYSVGLSEGMISRDDRSKDRINQCDASAFKNNNNIIAPTFNTGFLSKLFKFV